MKRTAFENDSVLHVLLEEGSDESTVDHYGIGATITIVLNFVLGVNFLSTIVVIPTTCFPVQLYTASDLVQLYRHPCKQYKIVVF